MGKHYITSLKGKHFSPRTEFKKGQHPSPSTEFKKGKNNLGWKGGKKKDKDGYIKILISNHPFCDKNGYVFEHRLIVEAQIGRYLRPKETPHHLGATDDNRPHMLMAFVSRSVHTKFHKNPSNVKPSEIIFDGRKFTHERPQS